MISALFFFTSQADFLVINFFVRGPALLNHDVVIHTYIIHTFIQREVFSAHIF